MTDFEKELASLINRHSLENESNTPEFILAEFLCACLTAFNAGVGQRDGWYGRVPPYATLAEAEKGIREP